MLSGADPGFQVSVGGALKKLLFRVKNHDFMPKNHIFSNFRGGATLDPPLVIMNSFSIPFTIIYIQLI